MPRRVLASIVNPDLQVEAALHGIPVRQSQIILRPMYSMSHFERFVVEKMAKCVALYWLQVVKQWKIILLSLSQVSNKI